ncbi:MAG: hypothetical protein WBD74_07265 [Candidatus Aquilonibacter sp.]
MRMIPLFIGIAVLAAFGLLLAPGSPGTVAVAATPTPTPVALQYDEISRVIMAPGTPPAPGAFAADYQLAMSAPPPQATPSNIQTPAPRPHGIVGSLSGVIPGMPGGSNTEEGAPGDASGAGGPGMHGMPAGTMTMMNIMRTGHLVRYTFYYTKGWIRQDDPVAQTATISKCNEHVFITLDLAKKTYTQTSTQGSSDCFQMPTMGGPAGRGGSASRNTAPGTEDLTIDATLQNLGPKTIDGIPTNGASSDLTMASTNATGSCQNSQFSVSQVSYISNITKPRAFCPLAAAPGVATDPTQIAAQGGCKPTLHGTGSMNFNSTKLEMYLLMSTTPQQSRGRSIGMLTERGHVTWLLKAQADPLFEVPAGFAPAQ